MEWPGAPSTALSAGAPDRPPEPPRPPDQRTRGAGWSPWRAAIGAVAAPTLTDAAPAIHPTSPRAAAIQGSWTSIHPSRAANPHPARSTTTILNPPRRDHRSPRGLRSSYEPRRHAVLLGWLPFRNSLPSWLSLPYQRAGLFLVLVLVWSSLALAAAAGPVADASPRLAFQLPPARSLYLSLPPPLPYLHSSLLSMPLFATRRLLSAVLALAFLALCYNYVLVDPHHLSRGLRTTTGAGTMGSSDPPRVLRLAVLECDSPQPQTRELYGNYTGVFTALLSAAAESSGSPPPGLSALVSIKGYDIVNELHTYPDLDEIDAVLLTGSRHNAFDNDPWIKNLVDFTKRALDTDGRVKVVGICFGHQIIGRALGAKVGKSDKGWEVAVTDVDLTPAGKEIFDLDILVSA